MQIPRQAVLLRIFIGEDDRDDGRPLYESIVLKARDFGRTSVAQIVDSEEKINNFLPVLETIMGSGLVTLEKVHVLQYGADRN